MSESAGSSSNPTDERRSWAEAVMCSLRLLPEPQLTVVSLAYFGRKSQAEIARELDLSADTVARAMSRGLLAIGRDQAAGQT